MRPFFTLTGGLAALLLLSSQAFAGKVEVKNVHLCCGSCARAVGTALSKVEGVSEAKCDRPKRTVTFMARDDKAAAAGLKALINNGFYGAATNDGKSLKAAAPTPAKGAKADTVVVKGVHVCCKSCQTAINKIFKDAKVTYTGKKVQKDVTVTGTGLDKAGVLEALRKAGLNGTVE
jgi:copper chaperone CopZ